MPYNTTCMLLAVRVKRTTEDIQLELVFEPGPSQPAAVCTLVSIADDLVVEEDQDRFIVLQTGDNITVTLSPASATLTIIDDDGMLIL